MESRHRSGIGVLAFSTLALFCWLFPIPAQAAERLEGAQASSSVPGNDGTSRPSLIRPHRKQQKATAPSRETLAAPIRPSAEQHY